MAARPTRTTNRLHFTDLDPIRFEDLCLALLYPLRQWVEIQHYGRLGGDDGVDVFAQEQLEDESIRTWYAQCRRYKSATKATLQKAVDDALANASTAPDVLLVVLACDVRRTTHEEYRKYALSKGVAEPMLWTASILESRLYAERQDLLFSYFGVSATQSSRSQEAFIRRNLSMKRRVTKELLKEKPSPQDLMGAPWRKFEYSEAIIHSIEDTSYPRVDDQAVGISGWFKSEFCDLYHNGIEFMMRVQVAVVDSTGRWAIVPYGKTVQSPGLTEFRAYLVGRIPYRNIVDIDTRGDEYYPGPHIYCRFADLGEPWEGFVYRYVTQGDEYPQHLDADKQVDYEYFLNSGDA